jgi:fructosamine-3-kinase
MPGFVKRRPAAPPGFFDVEAAGLRWLDVAAGVPVAKVLAVSADSITLTQLLPVAASPQAAHRFGTQLAHTHDAGARAFGIGPDGWRGDGFIGDAPLSLRPHDSWGSFYATERVLPYARAAHRLGRLSHADLTRIEELSTSLIAGDFDDDAPPARIHGDLWAGNVLFCGDGVTLIDPAAHGGHRITDLAMLELFGLAHLSEVFAGYEAASSQLPSNWRALVGLHQLHPLLVHAVLFGADYPAQAAAVSRRYLR